MLCAMKQKMLLMVLMVIVVMTGLGQVQAYSGKVLLVSMDGFRWDYLHKVPGLRHFPRLAATGCSVHHVNNPFATKTFPCHYTIATGLWEESHGIVSNRMYDPKTRTFFTIASTESYWWEGGEPIWITAEKQRRNSSAVFFWPGSNSENQGLRPSIYMDYNQSIPFEERVNTVVSWFADHHKDFVAMYFHEPDATGHRYGPDSPEIVAKVVEMDAVLGHLLTRLEERNLTNVVNLIVTSDHGMTSISIPDKLLDLWAYVDRNLVELVPDSYTVTAILPKAGQEAEVLRQARRIPHVTVYRKEDTPEHWHYKNNDRIMPIIILSHEGWTLSTNVTFTGAWQDKGNHGYSNDLPSMKPIFFARGPDFRKGVKSTSIRSVDIYPLLCRLLRLQPAPHNGSLANTAVFLMDSSAGQAPGQPPSSLSVRLVCGLVLMLFVRALT